MLCAYKFRIYPTKEQEEQIQKTFNCTRYVYNHYLALRKQKYEEEKETFGWVACCSDLTELKKKNEWLKEADSIALVQCIRNLDAAYQNFFRRVKNGENPGYPRFKSRKDHNKTYKTKVSIVTDDAIKLPKVGMVRCVISRPIEGHILSATVSQVPSGKYYISLNCSDVEIDSLPSTGAVIGLGMDFTGRDIFAVDSEGNVYQNPQFLDKQQEKIKRLQQKLSRKTKDGKNWEKTRIQIAKIHEHIANQRQDMLHKLSTKLVSQYDVICIKDMNLETEKRDQTESAKSIADAAWGEFKRQLQYKAEWYGKRIVIVDKEFSSSTICSTCGALLPDEHNESVISFSCSECGAVLDRQCNDARNILSEGLKLLENSKEE